MALCRLSNPEERTLPSAFPSEVETHHRSLGPSPHPRRSVYALAPAGSALLIQPVTQYKAKSCSYWPRPHRMEPTALHLDVQTLWPGFLTLSSIDSYPVGARIPWPGIPYTCDPLHFSKLSLWLFPSSRTYQAPPSLIDFHSWLLWGSHEGPGGHRLQPGKKDRKVAAASTTHSPSSPATVSFSLPNAFPPPFPFLHSPVTP